MPPAAHILRGAGHAGVYTVGEYPMIFEKSQGSVWSVALVAVAVLLGAMAVSSLVSASEPTAVASAAN